ncbi:unnamed protein product [Ambrosiozyma monospora]|uniref:Unnamed protein product n=1 Tax=Ambrosiozyma monospora TaxID=43982 RepID=A0ACB5U011_AMBMO|nr:unnamed protein product [Ambrosiozyma monospora]
MKTNIRTPAKYRYGRFSGNSDLLDITDELSGFSTWNHCQTVTLSTTLPNISSCLNHPQEDPISKIYIYSRTHSQQQQPSLVQWTEKCLFY